MKNQFGVGSSEFGRGVKMNEDKFDFENLKVYQKALEYVDFVYKITKGFPKEELFFDRSIQESGDIHMFQYSRGQRRQ